jgi:hypothetical protein
MVTSSIVLPFYTSPQKTWLLEAIKAISKKKLPSPKGKRE